MKRNRFVTIFSYVILAGCMIWFIGSGVAVLSKKGSVSPDHASKGEVCEFSAIYTDEAFEVKNSVNFIPTGKEHYYLMVSEDGFVRFLVRAKPSWIKKHFADNGFAEGGGVKIKGIVVRMDYDLTKEVRDMNSKLVGGTLTAEESINTSYYIDARYKEFGRLRIFSGIGVIVVGVLFYFGMMSGILQNNKFIKAVFGIVSVGIALLLIYTLSVGGFGI